MSLTSPEMIDLLRCPESGSQLTLLQPEQIEQLNQMARDKNLFDRAGQTISTEFESGAINQEQSWIYPVRDGIISSVSYTHLTLPTKA